jgi:predicted membrane channel-forming protein YqfA (hemolysin III family)
MNDSFLYTFPQWFVFAALFMTIYGWIENKKAFRLIGISIFILLGIYSLAILLGDYLTVGNYLTPEEVVREEIDGDILNEVPFQAKLLPAYWSFLISSVLAIPGLLLDWKDKKHARTFIVITGLFALVGFFIVVGTIRSL